MLVCNMQMPPEGIRETAAIIRLSESSTDYWIMFSFLKILALVWNTDRGVPHQLDHGWKIAAVPHLVYLKSSQSNQEINNQ